LTCVYDCASPRCTIEFELPGCDQDILLVDPRSEVTGDPPASFIASSGVLDRRADVFVVRGADPAYASALRDDRRLRGLLNGFDAATLVGGLSARSRKPQLKALWGKAPLPPLRVLRELETHGLVRARGGVLHAGGDHYHLESGYHQTSYVRLRDVLLDLADLRRIADWFMPFVDQRTVVLGSRPSLAPLILAIQLAAQRRFGWKLSASTLESYPRAQRSAARSVSDLLRGGGRLLVVVGVDRDDQQANELLLPARARSKAITLVDISTRGTPRAESFARFPTPRWRVDAQSETCGDTCSLDRVIGVDPATEELKARPRRSRRVVASTLFRSKEDFWEAVSETSALRLHQDVRYPENDDAAEPRHRPIDIDLGRLLHDNHVWTTCKSRLAGLPATPDVALIPSHDVSEALEVLVQEVHPKTIPAIVEAGPLDADVVDVLHSATDVLILDDAIVTGKTVLRMLDRIRVALGDEHFAEKRVSIFTPLLCPSHPGTAKRIRNKLAPGARSRETHFGLSFIYAYDIPLPDDEACPWCEEKVLLTLLRPKLRQHERVIANRLKILSKRRPVPDDLLIHPGISAEDVERVVADSVVGEHVAVSVVYAAFASAVQQLRHPELDGDSDPEPYIDLAHLTANWWGVGMFAGVLRSVTEAEGKYAAQAAPLARAWSDRERAWRQGELMEFAWAAISDRLPADAKTLVREAVEARRGDSPALNFAADLLEQRLAR
jgi:hypothetical protein